MKAFEKIKAGLDEAAVIAPYVAEIERLTKERDDKDGYIEELAKKLHTAEMARDAAIARAEAAEERFKKAVLAGIEVGQERDALRALLREALPHIQDRHGFTFHDLRARIAAATGEKE